MLEIIPLKIEGPKKIRPKVFHDDRGFFLESYREPLYKEGINTRFVQVNLSYSKKGTLRGMHFQLPNQAKLVTVLTGKIFDVFVDVRPNSPTFGKWEGVYLDEESHEQLFIPGGFAHGFCVLSEDVRVLYKVSEIYDPKNERSFRYDDPDVAIQWPAVDLILSEKDQKAPSFKEIFS